MTHKTTPNSELDRILTAQFAVAWAGEKGEELRLGRWRSDLFSEFGGLDLFRRLTAQTSEWAVWQVVLLTARRKHVEMRNAHDQPGWIASLFNLGFATYRRGEEWPHEWNRSGICEVLEGLAPDRHRCWLQVNAIWHSRFVGLQYEATNGSAR